MIYCIVTYFMHIIYGVYVNVAMPSPCKMSAILATAGHDLYHPGVNQAFLVATSHPLAIQVQQLLHPFIPPSLV